jgi:hypothetical protein
LILVARYPTCMVTLVFLEYFASNLLGFPVIH